MEKIDRGFILTSAVYPLKMNDIKNCIKLNKIPENGDVVYGEISHIGQHSNLENKSGRIHKIHNGSKGIFVFGNRYSPDYYEAFIPVTNVNEIDLISGSGLIGEVKTKNSSIKDPSRVRILGYVCDENENVLNLLDYPIIESKKTKKSYPRSKMIVVCGTSKNSGKSIAAASLCWILSNSGHRVKGSKLTGTANLKDILHMNDAGADTYSDFTFLGHPSTYMLNEEKVIEIFNKLDLKYANDPESYWVVELADGINQRETEFLLKNCDFRNRIYKLVFCANDTFGALGGIQYIEERLQLYPDIISGVCTGSPLYMKEMKKVLDVPVFDSLNFNIDEIKELIL